VRSIFLAPLALVLAGSAPSPKVIEIVGSDYSFRAPASAAAGPTVFRFRNNGRQRHELNIFLLRRGATIDQFLKLQKAGESTQSVVEGGVGVLFAEPDASAPSALSVNLLAGREYGVICIFRDEKDKPRHYEMGMYSVIRATGTQPAVTPVRVDSIVAVDYAYTRFPRELSPGRHTISFRNTGKHRHEINIALLKKGITLDSIIARDKKDLDVEPLFEKNGGNGVLHSRAATSALGSLVVDFLPGREYLVDCSFQDDEKSPPHYKLGMYGSIKVRAR